MVSLLARKLAFPNRGAGRTMFSQGRYHRQADATFFIAEAGNPGGEPVVLLHGGLGSRTDFAPLAAGLAADFRLVAVDSRGHGRSTLGARRLSYRQLADDTAALLGRLGLATAGIIGHSDGGIVALRLAAAGPLRPRFVVTAGAHAGLPPDDPARALYRDITAAGWREMFADAVATYVAENPEPDFDRLFDATRAMWLADDADAYPGDSVRAITAPLLVLHGDDDFLVSRRQACDLADMVGGARLLNLPQAGHTLLADTPDDVIPHLRRFIASLTAAN